MIANNQRPYNYPDTSNEIWFIGCLPLWWPLPLCRAIANEFHPTTHKVSPWSSKAIILPKTMTFCYSHHLSQSTLCESDWFIHSSYHIHILRHPLSFHTKYRKISVSLYHIKYTRHHTSCFKVNHSIMEINILAPVLLKLATFA